MKILYVGAGFVGTASAAVAAGSGHETLVYDIDKRKIENFGSFDSQKIESTLFEDGLSDLLTKNKDRIRFTDDYANVAAWLSDTEAVFMCLPTPSKEETGEADLSYYFDALEKLAETLKNIKKRKRIVIINKSTVPIGTARQTASFLNRKGIKNVGVASNPEFLVEGKAVSGTLKPDRVVVGAESEKDFDILRNIYRRFYDAPDVAYIETSPEEAEAGKLLSNYLLFNKLAECFDVVGRTAESFDGIRFENLRKIIASDRRIGEWGLYDSIYAGGSCFIKDARSLAYQLKKKGYTAALLDETLSANNRQLQSFLERAEEAGFSWKGKRVALLGLSFKRDTNDIRHSPSLKIVPFLQEKKAREIVLFDPSAMPEFKKAFPETQKLIYKKNAAEAIKGSDCVVIATDWPEFRELGDVIIAKAAPRALIMDGRRMLAHRYEDLRDKSFFVIAVGSPVILQKQKTARD
ncbi:nucleotide sugar dehydrogenase [bacterium]|nr:nucleotide sugar dehydrogenase [bacterium]